MEGNYSRDRIESSIIIPVHNQWHLTRDCLAALKKTIVRKSYEVIVVDNGSSDATVEECPALGEALFGRCFYYYRSECNLNFGPASNLGATFAKGEFLVFLNNDTVPLFEWYESLLNDFALFPDIAATGPVLLYPKREPFGFTVQHLGMLISPTLKVGHLYEGIPADSLLAQKRRFFQAITAACMMIRRKIFDDIGGFDERFINGLEDVDLCARLWKAGYKMTVNPKSRVIHHTGQTPGRYQHEMENFRLLMQGNLQLLAPDWHIHLKNDGLRPKVNSWLSCYPEDPDQLENLSPLAELSMPERKEALLVLINKFPLDYRLYKALADILELEGDSGTAISILETGLKICSEPDMCIALKRNAAQCDNIDLEQQATALLKIFLRPFSAYVNLAEQQQHWCAAISLVELAEIYATWVANKNVIFQEYHRPFTKRLRDLLTEEATETSLVGARSTSKKIKRPVISVIIPSYNYANFLPYTLENVLAEQDVKLDIIVVDDGSVDNTSDVVKSFGKDVRYIKQENQGPSAARNTGIRLAEGDYFVFLDADDLVYPGTLLSQYETLERNVEADLAICHNQLFESPDPAGPFSPKGCFPLPNGAFPILFCHHNVAPVHAFMARRAIVEKVVSFDVTLRACEDYDFWLKCLAQGCQIAINDSGLALYRKHAQSLSTQKHQQQLMHEAIIRDRIEHLLTDSDNFAAGLKANGWLALATRCFGLIFRLSDFAPEKSARLMKSALVAIKNMAKSATVDTANSLYVGNAGSVSKFHALQCTDYLHAFSTTNIDGIRQAQQIMEKLFNETTLGKSQRSRLEKNLYIQQNTPNLYISDFAEWKLEREPVSINPDIT